MDDKKCACPWRHCQAVLEHSKDWSKCLRHIYYHAYHTYIKTLGDDELKRRNIALQCKLYESMRNSVPDLPDPLACKWEGCEVCFKQQLIHISFDKQKQKPLVLSAHV